VGAGAGMVSVRENEDIYLRRGVGRGLKARNGRAPRSIFVRATTVGAKCGLKENLNFKKNLLKSAI